MKKIVLTFPGIRGTEIPLLYFCSKFYEDQGYEKLFVAPPADGSTDHVVIFRNAEKTLSGIRFEEYGKIVFIGKSMGTVVADMLKEKYRIPAELIFLTPLDESLGFIRRDNGMLYVAMGDEDKHLPWERAQEACRRENIPFYLEQGVGHRMEVSGDIVRNTQIIRNVVAGLEKAVRD